MQTDVVLSGGQAAGYGAVEGLVTAKGEPKASTQKGEEQEEPVEEAPKPDWEARGTIVGLIIDVGSVSAHRIVVLVGLMFGLKELEKNFIACYREQTPLIESYSEEIFCHYTKAYVFCFPAIATGVLLLLMGRDLLQKRLYYGLLKAGAAVSFSENVAYKDPIFLAMVLNFFHCVAFYVFTLNILARGGDQVIDAPDIEVTTLKVTTMTTTGQIFVSHSHPAMAAGSHIASESAVSYATVKLLAMHFMPSVLVIVFVYLAYDITISLVPLTEYLNAFEAEDHSPIKDLCTFKDSIAKSMLENGSELVATSDGDLPRLYEGVVDKYQRHRFEIQPEFRNRKSLLNPPVPTQAESEQTELVSPRWGKKMKNLGSIGLGKSLWPAQLLLRRDINGEAPKGFRLFWIIFATIALLWLLNLQVFLIILIIKEAHGLYQWNLEEAIPLTIVVIHMVAVGMIMYVYCETLMPLLQTRSVKEESQIEA